jgi:glycosyltransferase involved in cell wall biosynthesis
MKILHVLPSLAYEWGGPPRYVVALTEILAKKGINVSVFASTDRDAVNRKIEGVEVKLFPKGFFSKLWTSYSPTLARALAQETTDFDLVHIHELWNYPNFAAYLAAKRSKKPFIVSIHGQLDPWCLDHKAVRKKIYASLIQKKILREAAGVQTMTEKGVRNISNIINTDNVFLVPNGLNKEVYENIPEGEYIESLYPELKNKIVLLFLGRITPKKGLEILAKAFGPLHKKIKDMHLLICGPAEPKYKDRIVKLLEKNGSIGATTFTGMITGKKKLAALSRADIFILPSYSEGFSASVLEAMACGLPIIITEHCNFLDFDDLHAGKIIQADADQLIDAVFELLDNPELCANLGSRARQLFFERYTMDLVADQMIDIYRDILSRNKYARR